jgi:uncharacterized membrane protein YhaH (DUF805 family)
VVVSTILGLFDYGIARNTGAVMFQHDLLLNLFSLATLIPSVTVTTRRLHDIDKSGWWQLAWLGIFIVAGIVLIIPLATHGVGVASMHGYLIFAAPAIMMVSTFVWVLIWMVRRSTDGDNRFGASYAPALVPE